jgi:hypothetical protein
MTHMPLKKLVEDNQPTIVQETTFSHDVLGRYSSVPAHTIKAR